MTTSEQRLLSRKAFPDGFPDNVVSTIDLMTMPHKNYKDVLLLGSSALRSQRNFADYDVYQIAHTQKETNELAAKYFANQWKKIIIELQKNSNIFIGDIKSGSIEEWTVYDDNIVIKNNKVIGYDRDKILDKITKLAEDKIIS